MYKRVLQISILVGVIGLLFSIIASSNDNALYSPSDRITAKSLHVFSERAVIEQSNLIWAKIADTHSMEPVLNAGSITLELPPVAPSDIKVGDIVSFNQGENMIIHRVVMTGEDAAGWFAATKGDNNPEPDPYKVRFDKIQGIVVGILY